MHDHKKKQIKIIILHSIEIWLSELVTKKTVAIGLDRYKFFAEKPSNPR